MTNRHLIALLTFVGAGLRSLNLDRAAVVDEAITMSFTWEYGPLELLTQLPLQQPHPPLYYLLVDAITAFGGDLVMVRLLSVILGTATIPVVFVLGRRFFDTRSGVFAAVIITLSPFHISLSQLARMYALVGLLTALSWWCLLKVFDSDWDRRYLAGFVGLSTALLYTHYFALLTLVAQAAWVLIVKPDLWRHRREAAASIAAVVGATAPAPVWLGHHLFGGGGGEAAAGAVLGLPTPGPLVLTRMVISTVFGWSVAQTFALHHDLLAFSGAGAVVIAAAAIQTRGLPKPDFKQPATVWLLVPIGIAIVVSLTVKPVLRPRYVVGSVLALYLVLGVLAKRSWENSDRVVVAVLIVAMVATIPAQVTADRNSGWSDAKDALEEQSDEGDKLVVVGSFRREQVYHLRDVDMDVVGEGSRPHKVDVALQENSTVWVLRSWNQQWTWDQQLQPEELGLTEYQIASTQQFGNIKLYKLERGQ